MNFNKKPQGSQSIHQDHKEKLRVLSETTSVSSVVKKNKQTTRFSQSIHQDHKEKLRALSEITFVSLVVKKIKKP